MLAPLECVAGKLQRPRRRSAQWACADGWYIRAGRRTHVPTFFLFWRHGCSAAAKFACLQRQTPAMFAQMPLFVYRHFTGAACTTSSDGRFALFSAPSTPAFLLALGPSNLSDMVRSRTSRSAVACSAHPIQNFLPGTTVAIVGAIWAHGTPQGGAGTEREAVRCGRAGCEHEGRLRCASK